MTPFFKKLNYKSQDTVLILNHPDSFQSELDEMKPFTHFSFKTKELELIDFVIAFATKQNEVDSTINSIVSKLTPDATVWMCYPKKSSKKYNCEFNRDTGWDIMGKHGYEGVRIIAVDMDWSALRFRHVSKIKKITRSKKMALTEEAKRRTTKQ